MTFRPLFAREMLRLAFARDVSKGQVRYCSFVDSYKLHYIGQGDISRFPLYDLVDRVSPFNSYKIRKPVCNLLQVVWVIELI